METADHKGSATTSPITVSQTAPVVAPTPRRRWWKRIGRAIFVWGLETFVGMIPLIAHEATVALPTLREGTKPSSALPEVCILAVVSSALALLSLLRDWFQGDATGASALTVALAVANISACLAGAFLYPYAANDMLTGMGVNAPGWMLLASLAASFMLAGERGFKAKH